ncbi:MAG TPA: glycosyltransferase, partial [Candidatus Dormibacteraeota bacterium]|nr:glycosyltransferase [Candidatus Dormibacteraeota bacterium]
MPARARSCRPEPDNPLSGAAVPLVVSVRDLVYSASVEGALAFSRDRLIVASDYMAACARALFARFRPLPPDALRVVRNGFSVEELRPRDPRRMRAELRLPDSAIALLYPHRTDPAKGLVQVMRAVRWLKTLLPAATYARLRLLVPISSRWEAPPGRSAHGPRSTPWEQAIAMAEDLGVEDRLHYHPWVPVDRLGEYYSAGAATLCVGDFVEAFGNVHVESELCGTPAIVSRVGAQRTVLPDDLVRKVDYGDHEAAAEHLVEVIGRSDRSGPELVDHVTRHYGLAAMLAGYEEALLKCRRGPE